MAKLDYFDKSVKVTGPYYNVVQKRNYVTYTLASKKRTQKTYAKYLMENHLGRALTKDETIDHIDRNKTNDVIGNLQILPASEHSSLDHARAKDIEVECAYSTCINKFMVSARSLRSRSKERRAGPFCGVVCRGKYGKSVQMTGNKLPIQEGIETEFYFKDKG